MKSIKQFLKESVEIAEASFGGYQFGTNTASGSVRIHKPDDEHHGKIGKVIRQQGVSFGVEVPDQPGKVTWYNAQHLKPLKEGSTEITEGPFGGYEFGKNTAFGKVRINSPGHEHHGKIGNVIRQQGVSFGVEVPDQPGKVTWLNAKELHPLKEQEEFDPSKKEKGKQRLVEDDTNPLTPFHDVAKKHGYTLSKDLEKVHVYKKQVPHPNIPGKSFEHTVYIRKHIDPSRPTFTHMHPTASGAYGSHPKGMDNYLTQVHAKDPKPVAKSPEQLEAEKQRALAFKAKKDAEREQLSKAIKPSAGGWERETPNIKHLMAPKPKRVGPDDGLKNWRPIGEPQGLEKEPKIKKSEQEKAAERAAKDRVFDAMSR